METPRDSEHLGLSHLQACSQYFVFLPPSQTDGEITFTSVTEVCQVL